ncbi:uncharacterized protein LTR77_001889 [Saxophila tyrrhenica]|uniref:DOMON domain-containing protein n=1 Tax=Saxophila tyrrhenica TaxID=1690608 RepID=A0AAV9PPV3_9PEZI|nr:hypothetical protein LTR77_001889 [Saxophila tyrrhenica]
MAVASQAQHLSKQCFSDVCYQLNIPQQTAKSGSGDIFFQISGPTSYSWIGLGQGSQMAGSNIFVVYTDGKDNVTLSPRRGTGHVEPEHDRSANVTLLEGSGISNGRMVANVLCTNCVKWQGGSTDFSGNSGDWIYASRPGDALDSTSVSEELEQHEANGSFTWDYVKAQGGSSGNPFIAAPQGSPSHTGMSSTPTVSSGTGNSGAESNTVEASSDSASSSDMTATAHGSLAAVTFLVLFPVGAALVRIPGIGVWIHAGFQIFSYCCFIAAAGMGIWLAMTENLLDHVHSIIGMVLLGVLFIQPLGGVLHHRAYEVKQSRTIVSYIHIWLGRLAILLGMINGGLGIQLRGDVKHGYIIAYSVVAGVMGVLFLAVIAFGEVQASRRPKTDVRGDVKQDKSPL